MKKGFTLIELLAVIIILAIVALIALPRVLNVVDEARISAAKSEATMIIRAVNLNCQIYESKVQMGILDENPCTNDDGISEDDLKEMVNNGNYKSVSITYENNKVTQATIETNKKVVEYDGTNYIIDGEIIVEPSEPSSPDGPTQVLYKDNSGANEPELLDNMIPVRYDGTNWVYADITIKESENLSELWYNHDEKMWANAVVLNSGVTKIVGDTISESEIALMYVWIPRYTYTIFNGEGNVGVPEQVINVKFESGTNSSGTVSCVDAINQTDASGNLISEICTDKNGSITNGVSTYTHPAFTFGTEELTGFWVGKFEVSGAINELTIKPNVDSLRNQTVSAFFTAIQNMTSIYGINGDSHMMKNMEWGAVAYLKQSQYGLGIVDIGLNNYYNDDVYKTGCGASVGSTQSTVCNSYNTETGILASTTGNVYGVYDMSGGAYEYVMGNMVDSSGEFYNRGAGFSTKLDLKYYDAYSYDSSSYLSHARGKLGDATRETLSIFANYNGGWYSDYVHLPYSTYSWFRRGGYAGDGEYAALFDFRHNDGSAGSRYSTRSVLAK